MNKTVTITEVLGKTLILINNKDNRQLEFVTSEGLVFVMLNKDSAYGNDASADLEDVVGSFDDLLNSPILVAEERVSDDAPKTKDSKGNDDSWYSTQWTFYELATVKGSVTLRWYCTASPHYSVSVDFIQVK